MYANLKRKYGQNFLIDKNILKKITNLIFENNINILEIGPGDGRLTDQIITRSPSKLTIIEIDFKLIENLTRKYSDLDFIDVINADFLDYKIVSNYDLVISNLPYNISSQILVKLSLLKKPPSRLILMFQKEFAKKLLEKKINALNSLVGCFYKIKMEFSVSKNCFRPVPKVDSCVLSFERLAESLLNESEVDAFMFFKRKLFSQKRKSLKNTLKIYNLDQKFNLNLRVEDLKISTLIEIFREIKF